MGFDPAGREKKKPAGTVTVAVPPTAAPLPAFWSPRFLASSALFDERKIPGERGGCGGLTGPKYQEPEAVEAARRSAGRSYCGGARAKHCCNLLWRRKCAQMRWGGGVAGYL